MIELNKLYLAKRGENLDKDKLPARKEKSDYEQVDIGQTDLERQTTYNFEQVEQITVVSNNKLEIKYVLKPLFIAIGSALVIGLVIGAIMLKMFAQLDGETASVTSGALVKNENIVETMNGLTAYVLQAGAFSKIENAQKWAKIYEKKGHQTIVWKKEDTYYLLAGLAKTEASAIAQAKSKNNIDIYVKEWQTVDSADRLTEKERIWLQSFYILWNQQLDLIGEEQGLLQKEWQKLLADKPKRSQKFNLFFKEIDVSLSTTEVKNAADLEKLLLKLWNATQLIDG